jgi:polysaccharide biosynthesis protein PslH
MNVLYLTNSVQHPAMHSTFRHYYFLKDLAREHEVTLLTLSKAPVPHSVMAELRRDAAHVHVIDATRPARSWRHPKLRLPAEVVRKASYRLRERAALRCMNETFWRLTRESTFDVVVSHGHSVAAIADQRHGIPLVLDICDATSELLRGRIKHAPVPTRPVHWLRYRQTLALEQRMIRATPYVSFISCRDRDALVWEDSSARVIPNAVDTEYWCRADTQSPNKVLMFHGAMDYRPNVDAATQLIREVLPRIQQRDPEVQAVIVGRDPDPGLLDAAANARGVVVTGRVADIRPYLNRATVYAAPLRFGAGQQNKLLEAMAMSVPVVTTSNGAMGLRVGPEPPPVVVADDVDEFALAVLALLNRAGDRIAAGARGRQYIAEYFSVERNCQLFTDMCVEAARHGPCSRQLPISASARATGVGISPHGKRMT